MQSNLLTALSVKKLRRAIAIREQIERLGKELERMTGGRAAPVKNGAPRRRRRRLSAAAKARISAAAKARWAKFRALKAKK